MLIFFLSAQSLADVTLTVTSTLDSGTGSLRDAITSATLEAVENGTVYIDFNLSGDGGKQSFGSDSWCRIDLTSNLPTITRGNIVIDGTTQPTSEVNNTLGPEIEIYGTNTLTLFTINSANNILRGVTLGNYQKAIHLTDIGSYNSIEGCYIGVTPTGESNGCDLSQRYGLYLNGSDYNWIGGSLEAQHNIISGNNFSPDGTGIMFLQGSSSNIIRGNYIGINRSGNASIPNRYGIYLSTPSYGAVVNYNIVGGAFDLERNYISGNSSTGIVFAGNIDNTEILGNYIGLAPDGITHIPNGGHGISLCNYGCGADPDNNHIGPDNIITSNNSNAIHNFSGNYNKFTRNSLYDNVGGIVVQDGNEGITTPEITSINYHSGQFTAEGTSWKNAVIEIFLASPEAVGFGQGKTYLGSTTANASGDWIFTYSTTESISTRWLTATQTSPNGSTSQFSSNKIISTPTPLEVTSTSDDDVMGTLRFAINYANSNSGADTITFNIPSIEAGYTTEGTSSWWRLSPATSLPTIEGSNGDSTVISGVTQANNNGDTNPNGPEIELTGIGAGSVAGLSISASNCTVEGLTINGFTGINGSGIKLTGNSNNILGCYIGLNTTGEVAIANGIGICFETLAFGNIVGPSNIIAFNTNSGIKLFSDAGDFNKLTRNSLYGNGNNGIVLSGGNEGITTPEITSINYHSGQFTAEGTSLNNAVIEIFLASPEAVGFGQGKTYLGSTTANASGAWIFTYSTTESISTRWLTATQTSPNGSTSQFSANRQLNGILDHFVLNLPSSAVVGTDFLATIEARDINNNLTSLVPETTILTMDAVGTVTPSIIPVSSFESDSGRVTFWMNLSATGNITVYISSGSVATSDSIIINTGLLDRYEWTLPSSVTVAQTFTATLSAYDAYNNPVTPTVGTVLSVSRGDISPSILYTTSFESGVAQFITSLSTTNEGSITLTATNENGVTTTESMTILADDIRPLVTIEAPALGDSISGESNYQIAYTVTDNVGLNSNPISIYFSTNEGSAWITITSETTYSGIYTAEAPAINSNNCYISVEAKDTANNSGFGLSGKFSIVYIPVEPVDRFRVVLPASGIEDKSLMATIEAIDVNGNITTGLTQTITLSVDQGTISRTSIDPSLFVNGKWSGAISFSKLGLRTITSEAGDAKGSSSIVIKNKQFTVPDSITGVIITVPEGLITSDANLSIADVTNLPKSLPYGYELVRNAFNVSGNITTFASPVSLTTSMTGKVKGGKVIAFDGSNWSTEGIDMTSFGDTSVEFATKHLSIFAIVGIQDSAGIRFGPNPYNPNNGNGKFWYWLDSDATTSIYVVDIRGTLVFKVTFESGQPGGKSGANMYEYDGKDQWRQTLGDGVYIYKIVQNGKAIGGGKIGVIK